MKDIGWYIKQLEDGSFSACKDEESYCVSIGSEGFEKAAKNNLAPRIKKTIGEIVIHDPEPKAFKEINSKLSSNFSLVLKEINRLHKLGLSYSGKIYVNRRAKRVHFTNFRERSKMSHIDWILEMIKDYETLVVSHRTEYSTNKKMQVFVKKIDRIIRGIGKSL